MLFLGFPINILTTFKKITSDEDFEYPEGYDLNIKNTTDIEVIKSFLEETSLTFIFIRYKKKMLYGHYLGDFNRNGKVELEYIENIKMKILEEFPDEYLYLYDIKD